MNRPLIVLLLIGATGCTHHQLRRSTVNQARTVADVHREQVLENLAKFARNPNSLPHFSVPDAGATIVTDNANGNTFFNFFPDGLSGWGFSASASRQNRESYTLVPINDPRKLDLMRCVYQQAVGAVSADCPNCYRRLNRFYLGTEIPPQVQMTMPGGEPVFAIVQKKPDPVLMSLAGSDEQATASAEETASVEGAAILPEAIPEDEASDDPIAIVFAVKDELGETVYIERALYGHLHPEHFEIPDGYETREMYTSGSIQQLTNATGRVTSACIGQCWYQKCCSKDLPKCVDECSLIGEYCGTAVIVPECHRDQLTRLTLTILDIALSDPAELPEPEESATVEVTEYFGADGRPTTKENAATVTVQTVKKSTLEKKSSSGSSSVGSTSDKGFRSLMSVPSIQQRLETLAPF